MSISVKLLSNSPLENIVTAGLTCTGNDALFKKYESSPNVFISRLIKAGHESVLEHVVYTFKIEGITRAVLQQLSRHRLLSLSVLSTRWALHKFLKGDILDDVFTIPTLEKHDSEMVKEFLDITITVLKTLYDRYGNDTAKYFIPECMNTKLVMTVNARELRHIFNLRSARPAMLEFNILCKHLFDALPEDHKFMYIDCVPRSFYSGGDVDSEKQ
ncbi:MAG: FAD-dependent thymidylate synthase [Clostridiales bacterium]|nr:FAD-dependent thymidylate synthase [Clostridiales bacterium]